MNDRSPSILTPDQRLRVFISSTIRELAEERAVARSNIGEMRLHPILFETGARPHPPRDLYRAYLDQSDIFVGIYWESYGWTAPDMEISGIEDEFELSDDMPKLIYVKEPAPGRDPGLRDLLERIAASGTSYKKFETPEELGKLLLDDIALLLTESFTTASKSSGSRAGLKVRMPAAYVPIVGREQEISNITELFINKDARLVTLVGPGGVGKSRLAIEIGHDLKESFADGTHFVMLESVRSADQVPMQIAASLDIVERIATPDPFELLSRTLADKELLLIIDNFEQVIEAGEFLVELLMACPRLKILVTSRAVLRLRTEIEYLLDPLGVPDRGSLDAHSVELFLARARRSPSGNQEEMVAVAEICRRLDGLPLAIELAAARTSLLLPTQILNRLEDRFALLRGGSTDLPERHKTMHDTIGWSVDLLSDDHRVFFRRLSVFGGGFTLDAADAVCNPGGDLDVLDALQALIENSMVRPREIGFDPRFVFYQTIREYAWESLEASGEKEDILDKHADYFYELVQEIGPGLRGSRQVEALNKIQADESNIHRAMNHLIDSGRVEEAAQAGWAMWPFWWIRGRAAQGRELGERIARAEGEVSELWRARAIAAQGAMALLIGDAGPAVGLLVEAQGRLDALGDLEALGLCQIALGMVSSVIEPENTMPMIRAAIESLSKAGDRYGLAIATNMQCWMDLNMDIDEVPEDAFEQALDNILTKNLRGLGFGDGQGGSGRAVPLRFPAAGYVPSLLDPRVPPEREPRHVAARHHGKRRRGVECGACHLEGAQGARRPARSVPHRRRRDRHRHGPTAPPGDELPRVAQLVDRACLLGHQGQDRKQARVRIARREEPGPRTSVRVNGRSEGSARQDRRSRTKSGRRIPCDQDPSA